MNWKDSNFDPHELVKLRKDYENNLIIIGCLNIKHLSSKIDYPREIGSKSPIDILRIDKTKFSLLIQMLNLKSQVINTRHIVKTETKMETAKYFS